MTKNRTKITDRKQFTADELHSRIPHYAAESVRVMHMCRHSGHPEMGLLVARSLFPIYVTRIHQRMIESQTRRSLNQMLEDLYSQQIIDGPTHDSLRRAAAALGDFGSGRDLKDVMAACDVLQRVTKSAAFKNAPTTRRTAKAKRATDRRPALVRWASAAVGLFSVSS